MRYRGNRKRITLLSLKKTICGANVTSRADLASAVQIRQARAAAVSAVWRAQGLIAPPTSRRQVRRGTAPRRLIVLAPWYPGSKRGSPNPFLCWVPSAIAPLSSPAATRFLA